MRKRGKYRPRCPMKWWLVNWNTSFGNRWLFLSPVKGKYRP
jgi:hypothetical protein